MFEPTRQQPNTTQRRNEGIDADSPQNAMMQMKGKHKTTCKKTTCENIGIFTNVYKWLTNV